MNRFLFIIKNKFLRKSFFIFILIGVMNTLIDTFTTWVLRVQLEMNIYISGVIAFIVASIFSYFANLFITFNSKKVTKKSFSLSMLVFSIRLILTHAILYILLLILKATIIYNYFANSTIEVAARFFASCLLIPISYLFLERILKSNKSLEEEK